MRFFGVTKKPVPLKTGSSIKTATRAAGATTSYCSECTTNDGLPGARFGPGLPCRPGYGCGGGALRTPGKNVSATP